MDLNTQIQRRALDFLTKAVYQLYFQARYSKYRLQFPKKKQSEVIGKIMKQWDAENQKQSIQKIMRFGQKINPNFKQYLRQTEDFWPNVNIWKIKKTEAAPKYAIQQHSSYQQFPVELISKKKVHKKKVKTEKDLQIMTYHYIQELVKSNASKKQEQPSYLQGYNLILETGQPINRQNLIHCSRMCRINSVHRSRSNNRQQKQEKIPSQINPNVRIFYQQKIKQFNTENYGYFEKKQEPEKFQNFETRKQILTTRKYSKKIMIQNQEADFSLENSIDQEFSSHSIERIKKYRIKKKRKMIKKDINLIFETKIKKNRHLLSPCHKCWAIIYKLPHQCKIHNAVSKKKRMTDNNQWFLPVYDHQNKVFGFCLICQKFKSRDQHLEGPDHLQGFPLYPIKPEFQISQEVFEFRNVKLHFQRFSNHYQPSNKVSFYEQINLGELPLMKENKTIKLSCKYVLTASQNIGKNIIFGPIGVDCLPGRLNGALPWQVNYFSHTLRYNQHQLVVCPLYRLNSLGFLVNKKQQTSHPNIELKIGIFNNEVCLFGRTLRQIICGEEIAVK